MAIRDWLPDFERKLVTGRLNSAIAMVPSLLCFMKLSSKPANTKVVSMPLVVTLPDAIAHGW